MSDVDKDLQNNSRRQLLKGALVGGAAIGVAPAISVAQAASNSQGENADAPVAAYVFFTPTEAAFIESLVDHMVPADHLTPKGTDLGINIFIDRALAGSWGKGDRMYMQGPWKIGTPSQGYQSPLLPAQLYRAGIAASNQTSEKMYGKTFDLLDATQKDDLLKQLDAGKIAFEGGLPSKTFFNILYKSVVDGMFADPIYGGNANKAGWKMLGFPGVVETNARNIVEYKNKRYTPKVLSIADMS
jgi:gluconate 2-dehydrogenase gamma chain